MAKRSDFPRIDKSKYYTPLGAVLPLKPHLRRLGVRHFVEPCAGDGRLIHHLESLGLGCLYACDIAPEQDFARWPIPGSIVRNDALTTDLAQWGVDIITNPPWERPILHPMIDRFMRIAPTWLLFDADWPYTTQDIFPDVQPKVWELWPHCTHVIAVGRVKWIENSEHGGKDNCAWYRFDISHSIGPRFYCREGERINA